MSLFRLKSSAIWGDELTYEDANQSLQALANPAKALAARRYFKNCSQDVFLGVTTPQLRRLARDYRELTLAGVRKLMQSQIHEGRSLANEILRIKFCKGGPQEQTKIFEFYMKNRKFIREWDGVD